MYAVGDAVRRSSPTTTRCCKPPSDAACDAVRPGVSAESVDAAARAVITAAGYGEFFIHRTGHGIGLETHEDPYIVAGNAEPLEPGMAVLGRARHLPARPATARASRTSSCARRPAASGSTYVPRELVIWRRAMLLPVIDREQPDRRGQRAARPDRRDRRQGAAPRRSTPLRRDARVPARRLPDLGDAGLLGLPTPRSTAGRASRTPSTCRSSRSSPAPGSPSGIGVSVHTLACFPLATVRHRRAEGALAARDARRRRCSARTACPSPAADPTPLRCVTRASAGRRRVRRRRRRRRGSPTGAWPTSTT